MHLIRSFITDSFVSTETILTWMFQCGLVTKLNKYIYNVANTFFLQSEVASFRAR
jgi:hypothetical protein